MNAPPRVVLKSPRIAHRERDLSHTLGWIALAAFSVPGILITINYLFGVAGFITLFWLAQFHGVVAALLGFGLANRGGKTGVVAVDEKGVEINTSDGAKYFHPHMIESGVVVPTRKGSRVELRMKDRTTLIVETNSDAESEAMLAHIRASGHAAGMTIGIQTPLPVAASMAMLVGWIVQGVVLDGFYIPILPLLLGALAFMAFGSTNVVVGDDGLTIKRFMSQRFIPFDQIVKMEQDMPGRLRVDLNNGEVVVVGARAAGRRYAHALKQRIEEAMNPETGSAAAALQVLSRGQRTLTEWRSALGGLFAIQPGYRGPRLTVQDALTIVSDATRTEEHRISAAVALADAKDLDLDAREKFRVAAHASANPRLRVVLEGLADEALDEAQLIEALSDATVSQLRP